MNPKLLIFISIVTITLQIIYATAAGLWLITQFGFPITSAFLIFIIGFAFLGAMFKLAVEIITLIITIIALFRS